LQLIIEFFQFEYYPNGPEGGEAKTHLLRGSEPKEFSRRMIEYDYDERNFFLCNGPENLELEKSWRIMSVNFIKQTEHL